MQKIYRKFTSLALIAALLFSFIPVLPISRVEAASGLYFLPDDANLNATANMDISTAANLNRSTALKSSSQNLTIAGLFQVVAQDSLTATVEQLTLDSTTSTWSTDSQHAVTTSVSNLSSNRFQVSNLTLFPGYNAITFKGIQNNIEKSDVFYVLYEDAPILQSLKVGSGTGSPVNLNEGASVVLNTNTAYFQGVVLNGTKVTINNAVTTVLADGSFFSQTIVLNPGINDVTFVFENQTSKLTVNRTMYYYDPTNPFINLDIIHANDINYPYSLLGANQPVLTGMSAPYTPSTDDQASLHVKMIVPYSPLGILSSVSLNVYNIINSIQTTTSLTASTVAPTSFNPTPVPEITIPSYNGSASYKLVEFNTTNFPFETVAISAPASQNQSVTLGVYYDGFSTSIKKPFQYLPGEIAINKVSYLNTDPTTAPPTTIPALLPTLNNTDVKSDKFYIVVDTDRPIPSTMNLDAILLPLSASTVSVAYVGTVDTTGALDTTITAARTIRQVYKITNLPVGAQQLKFKLLDTIPNPDVYLNSSYTASINYISGSYVYLENITDGKTFSFDSTITTPGTKKIPIKGGFIDFNGFLGTNAEFYVNGVSNPTFRTAFTAIDNSFNFSLDMSNAADSLYYGENHLVFIAKFISTNSTQVREIRKEIKIYILDPHAAYIASFQPGLVPTTTGGRPILAFGDPNIFKDPTQGGIVFNTNKWVTSLKTYDLVLDAGAASSVALLRNGVPLFPQQTLPLSGNPGTISQVPPVVANPQANPPIVAKPGFELLGDQDHFILRVLDLSFDAPGAHIYTLELRNSSGARITQKLEIDRQLAQYRILSPISTVSDKIVVNKNFVHFDIEAEGADSVLIDGKQATKRDDITDRFVYDYNGLKPGKVNSIKIAVKQAGTTSNSSVDVSYINSFEPGAQFMEKLSAKHSIFDKRIEINFPKGTALKGTNSITNTVQYYDSNNLLFGLADPKKGLVETRNDYGNLKGTEIDARTNAKTPGGQYTVLIPDALVLKYQSELDRANFTPISPVYWINAGLGEKGTKGKAGYQLAVNGVDPYAVEGTFTFDPDRKLEPTNRGTIALKYDSTVVESAGTLINVFVMNETGKWINLGGEVDAKNNIVKVPFSQFGYYMVTKMRYGFSDVTNHPWARNVLEGLFSKGIMPNLRYNEFGTDDNTTRGEFATLLVKALNIPLNYDDNFSFLDVPSSTIDNEHVTWDYKHVETAARIGIISGLDNRVFAPDSKLTREQAATIIARALELKLAVNDSKLLTSLSKSFTDASTISFYALPSIDAVVKAGIMLGKAHDPLPGLKKGTVSLDPLANLTRAEAGQISIRLLQKATKMFPTNLN